MTELSPAAQGVLDAFRTSHTGQGCLAAALRAVADQVVPKTPPPKHVPHYDEGIWDGKYDVREQLLAIAAELDGIQPTSESV